MATLRFTILGAAVLGFSLTNMQQAQAALIQLKPQCTATSTVIRLVDIAEIRDADPTVVQRLEKITLQPAPAAGRRAQIRLGDIKLRLQALGENMGMIEFRGASSTTVHAPKPLQTSKSQKSISNHQMSRVERLIATAVGDFIKRQGMGMQVAAVSVPDDPKVVRALLLSSVSSWQVSGGQSMQNGTRKYVIHTGGPQGHAIQFEVSAQLTSMPRMLVLRRPVDRGHVIQLQDLAWKPVGQLPRSKAILNHPDEVVGLEAIRPLSEGNALSERDVRKSLLIKRGDTVHVYSRWGAVKIRMDARAREDGAFGDQVMLRILDNDETVVAKVIGFHVAEITPSLAQPNPRDGGLRIKYSNRRKPLNRRQRNVVQTTRRLPQR